MWWVLTLLSLSMDRRGCSPKEYVNFCEAAMGFAQQTVRPVPNRRSDSSLGVMARQAPGARSPSINGPMATRTSRKAGWPTAAVMRLTWRFIPSCRTISTHAVGTVRRTLIGTDRFQFRAVGLDRSEIEVPLGSG